MATQGSVDHFFYCCWAFKLLDSRDNTRSFWHNWKIKSSSCHVPCDHWKLVRALCGTSRHISQASWSSVSFSSTFLSPPAQCWCLHTEGAPRIHYICICCCWRRKCLALLMFWLCILCSFHSQHSNVGTVGQAATKILSQEHFREWLNDTDVSFFWPRWSE